MVNSRCFSSGCIEKKIARMVGLSKTAVRNIILNYKRTGDPSLPKRDSKKIKGKLLVEYDENGKLMMSDDEAEDEEEEEEDIEPKVHSKKKQYKVQKHSPKIKKTITTKDLIEYMVEEVKRYDKEYSPVSTFMEETYQQHHHHIWCPTPPREGSIHETNHSNPNSVSPSYLPLSPPVSSNKSSRHGDTDDDDELDDHHHHQQQQQQQKSPIALNLPSPSPPPSSNNNLSAPSPYDQTIRGYEPWTHKEDLILMHHAMSHLQVGHWRELESRFEGRHTNRLCMERWNFLRTRLLKSIIQSITNEDQQQSEIKSSLINDEYRV
ncbi:unnamed protein product [Cunninghamella echinulata]